MSVDMMRKPCNRTLLCHPTNGAYQVILRSRGSIGNVVRVEALLVSQQAIASNLDLAVCSSVHLTLQIERLPVQYRIALTIHFDRCFDPLGYREQHYPLSTPSMTKDALPPESLNEPLLIAKAVEA
jgi:hypothetical protein